jgi:hypothetical protein
MVFAWVQEKTTYDSPALMPEESTETTNLILQENEI